MAKSRRNAARPAPARPARVHGPSKKAQARPAVKKAAKWAQFLLILLPAALALWVLRRDRRALLLASLPVFVGITYAAILISPRYVFPLMPVVILMAAAGWLHCYEWVSGRLQKRRSRGEAGSG